MYQNNRAQQIQNEVVMENTVDGRIIPVRDGEAIVFEILLEPFKIVAIANIPEEGKTTAPVYLKFKMNDGRSNNGFRKRYPRDPNAPPRFQDRSQVPVEYARGDNANGGSDYREDDDNSGNSA